jgi:hypothetical protein
MRGSERLPCWFGCTASSSLPRVSRRRMPSSWGPGSASWGC